MSDLELALHVMRTYAEQGNEQERVLAERITTLVRNTAREQRRARAAGNRMFKMARKYKEKVAAC